jgi:branched-chain amino acid transport system ATP-binding protein
MNQHRDTVGKAEHHAHVMLHDHQGAAFADAPNQRHRALEIAITIAGGADVILLDEPTAGMSGAETDRAVALIRRISEGRTLMIVEHDMSVVFGLADRISVLVHGEIVASGPPAEIRNNPKVREAYLGEETH